VPGPGADWSAHQLAEFLAAVSSFTDQGSAKQGAVERAAEAFEAEVGALIEEGDLSAVVGFPPDAVPTDVLLDLGRDSPGETDLRTLGTSQVLSVPLGDRDDSRFLVARAGSAEFSVEERNLLRAMGRVLELTLGMLERQRLLEHLSRIQRSISHRAPLREVLDAVTTGASDLLGVEVAGLRLIDPGDPAFVLTASAAGVDADAMKAVLRMPLGQGAGGRAISEDRLVIIEDYASAPGMVPHFASRALQVAMAAPVHENGVVVGSLVVASYKPGRRFSGEEQDALLALAEHASLALTDAKIVEEMREAQRSKDLFLAMVSHELKTPLTVIMGGLRTLEVHGEDLPAELRHEILAAGWHRGRELERLINRLLQGARAELVPRVEDVDLFELVAEGVRGLEHSRRVRFDVPTDVAIRVDRPAVLEVLGILLENAVSHSGPGTDVWLDARVERRELVLGVANEGQLPEGVDPETLFRPFQRGDDTRSPGVGLGLYIASRVAESIDGKVSVETDGGRVRFVLRVPVFEVGAGLPDARPGPRDDIRAPAPMQPGR